MSPMTFGEVVKRERLRRGISQGDMSDLLRDWFEERGLQPSVKFLQKWVSDIEKGVPGKRVPEPETFRAVCDVLLVPAETVLVETGYIEEQPDGIDTPEGRVMAMLRLIDAMGWPQRTVMVLRELVADAAEREAKED